MTGVLIGSENRQSLGEFPVGPETLYIVVVVFEECLCFNFFFCLKMAININFFHEDMLPLKF